MRLAASNIAWSAADDVVVAGMLRRLGYEGIEIAPTRVWPEPLATSPAARAAFRREWEEQGLPVVAMQALVFGRPDLTLFGDAASRDALAAHLHGMIDLGADLGAHALVFGSPKNRARGALSHDAAVEVAIPFFRALGEHAALRGTSLVLEANPPEYGCDFVTVASEALDLVRRVDSPGFRLHLDAGGMTITGDAVTTIAAMAGKAVHYHASEPRLAAVGTVGTDHGALAAELTQAGYRGWVSVEMRSPEGPRRLEILEASLAFVAAAYHGR